MKGFVSFLHMIRSIVNRPLEKIVYHVSGFFIRDKKLWVMGAQKKSFSCNPKHFFINTSLNKELKIRCVWISKNKEIVSEIRGMGLKAENLRSLKGVYYCLKAGFYFINSDTKDICFVLSKGARYVNMWHGIPLKKIQNDNDKNEVNVLRVKRRERASSFDKIFNPRDLFTYDYLLSTSDYVTEYSFSSAFDIPKERCLSLGYPRTDIFFKNKNEIDLHVKNYSKDLIPVVEWVKTKGKVYLYAPTWRDTKKDFIELSGIDFVELDEWLVEKNYCFLLKMHPYTNIDLSLLNGLESIKVVDKKADIYPLMTYVDTLITDYSSIYFDFILMDKPVVFFPFDIKEYLEDCRSFYLDYYKVTPGFKVYSYKEMLEVLSSPCDEELVSEREKIRRRFWGGSCGNSSEELALKLMKL